MELTAKQKQAYELMKSGANVFLTGEAGTGKSFVLNQFLNKREDILVCAPTGIAAIHVKGATLHRTFKVPLRPIGPEQKGRKPTELILRTKCFVIDEISMCRFDVFHFVAKIIMRAEEMARTLNLERGAQIYPEKKQIICCGDFFQLPPVITDRDREVLESLWGDIGDGFAFRSPLWEKFQFQTVMLDEVMRQKKDSAFVENLNYIRKGEMVGACWMNQNTQPHEVAGIRLCVRNKDAEMMNNVALEKLGTKKVLFTADIGGCVEPQDYPNHEKIIFKQGARVMSLINDPSDRYQNGSLGIVLSISDDAVKVRFDNGAEQEFGKYTWEMQDFYIDPKTQKIKTRTVGFFSQIPLKIAYAVTIHKSQGQTYDAANIDTGCFAPGQLYVALSRVRTADKIHLTSPIKSRNLETSQEVLDFYNLIHQW